MLLHLAANGFVAKCHTVCLCPPEFSMQVAATECRSLFATMAIRDNLGIPRGCSTSGAVGSFCSSTAWFGCCDRSMKHFRSRTNTFRYSEACRLATNWAKGPAKNSCPPDRTTCLLRHSYLRMCQSFCSSTSPKIAGAMCGGRPQSYRVHSMGNAS
jgi:hypothetical protein